MYVCAFVVGGNRAARAASAQSELEDSEEIARSLLQQAMVTYPESHTIHTYIHTYIHSIHRYAGGDAE